VLGPLYGIVLPILIEVSLAQGSYCFLRDFEAERENQTIVVTTDGSLI